MIVVNADGTVDTLYYCRQGDELLMRGVNDTGQIYVYELTQMP
jgi:hypothetical protein